MPKRIKRLFSATVFTGMFVYFAHVPSDIAQEFTINWDDIKELIQPEQTIAAGPEIRPSFIPSEWKYYSNETKHLSFWYPHDGQVKQYIDHYKLDFPAENDADQVGTVSFKLIPATDVNTITATNVAPKVLAIGGLIGKQYDNEQEKTTQLVLKDMSGQNILITFDSRLKEDLLLEKVLMSLQLR